MGMPSTRSLVRAGIPVGGGIPGEGVYWVCVPGVGVGILGVGGYDLCTHPTVLTSRAGGTHPTGMLSCFILLLLK